MHLEALKSKQKEVFETLKRFKSFYLVGGTALALQLGHRFSVDFDLFRQKKLDKSFWSRVYRTFKGYNLKVDLRHSEQVNLKVDSVKFNFVKCRYPLLWPLKEFQGVKMACPKEIAVMKAFTLGGRAALKDYVDLYFILKQGLTDLDEIRKSAEQKYKGEFNFRLFLEELTYLDDIDMAKQRVEFLAEPVAVPKMLKFFEEQITKIEL